MSGLFGRELDPGKWLSFGDAAEAYLDFAAGTLTQAEADQAEADEVAAEIY